MQENNFFIGIYKIKKEIPLPLKFSDKRVGAARMFAA